LALWLSGPDGNSSRLFLPVCRVAYFLIMIITGVSLRTLGSGPFISRCSMVTGPYSWQDLCYGSDHVLHLARLRFILVVGSIWSYSTLATIVYLF